MQDRDKSGDPGGIASHPQVHEPQQHAPHKKSFMDKLAVHKIPVFAVASAFVLLGGALAFLSATDTSDTTNNEVVVQQEEQSYVQLGSIVTVIDGDAYARSGSADWEKLEIGETLSEGQAIRTEGESRVIIALDDGSAVRLDNDTTIELSSLDPQDIKITNVSGQVYSRVVESDRKFSVDISGVSYEALGTAYNTINNTTDKGVQVLHSKVRVDDEEVKEGKQYYKENKNKAVEGKVTDLSVEDINDEDGFMFWNLEYDKKDDTYKDKLGYLSKLEEKAEEAEATATAISSAGITLSASNVDKGTSLSWSLRGVSAPNGFKVVRSKTATPSYGAKDSESNYTTESSLVWSANETATYNYRVCAYRPAEGSCYPYSNQVAIKTAFVAPQKVKQGSVSLSLDGDTAKWTDTGTAPHGWKLLVSTKDNPIYGSSTHTFYAAESPVKIKDIPAGTYFVRVCKYTASNKVDNGCTNYSNQLEYVRS